MSVEIRVYPNKIVETEYEKNTCDAGLTIEQYLIKSVASYERLEVPLYSMTLNKKEVLNTYWAETLLSEGDLLEIFIEPKEPMTIAMVVIAVVSAAAAIYYANQIPDNYNSTTPNGSSVYDANAQGNKVRLMGIVPEHLGLHVNYPDVLNSPRRVFADGESWKYLFLCVGEGEYEINTADILIGNTAIDRYATDIEHQVFGPNEDVSGHEAHRNFYTSPEVDSNGLEINHPETIFIAEEGTGRYIETSPNFGTDWLKDLRFYDGTGQPYNFPWPVGSRIQLDGLNVSSEIYEGVVDIVDMGIGVPDKIIADYGLNVAPVGASVQLVGAGDNDNNYLIKTISDTEITFTDLEGDDVVNLTPLSRVLVRILKDDPLRDLYEVESGSGQQIITVSKVGDPDWAGFTSNLRYYDITCELIDGSVTPTAIGPFVAAPANKETSLIELDFLFDGLNRLDSSGNVKSHTVSFKIQYREINTQDWTEESHEFTEATRDQFGRTIVINLPKNMAVEVQVERTSHQEDNIRLSEKVRWVALRAEMPTVTSYEGMTTLALKIRGTNALASTAENKVNLLATRKLLTFDEFGELTKFEATRDIAPAMYYVASSAGYTLDQIGLGELYDLHQTWQSRGDEFNAIFDNEITVWEAFKRILDVGFAKPTLDFGQIIPVRDEKRDSINFMWQADNMIKNSWKMDATLVDESESDGVEVEYFSLETRQPEVILCTLPEQQGINPEQVRPFGITSRDKAYQYGMRKLSVAKYRRKKHQWTTEMDGLNTNYLSYDALGVDIPGFSRTGRVEAISEDERTFVVNQDLDWSGGTNYIGFRSPEGMLSGPYVCAQGADVSTVIISEDLDFTPVMNGTQEPPLFMFGVDEQWCERVLILDIKPQGTDRVKMTAINDDDRCYLYDDAVAPE